MRDIEVNLRAQARRLYHMGFRCQTISRNTLANANATRPWQIYADFAQHLIALARPLYATEPFGLALDAAVYAFDASTIDLCLSVFAWAPFRSTKAAIKLLTVGPGDRQLGAAGRGRSCGPAPVCWCRAAEPMPGCPCAASAL